jgi:hypothetical protein
MTPTATENAPPKAMAHTPFLIPLAQIRESKTNPRTHFDKT